MYANIKKQIGQSMTEYTIAVLFTAIVLFVGGNASVRQEVVDAIKGFFTAYSFAISVAPQ